MSNSGTASPHKAAARSRSGEVVLPRWTIDLMRSSIGLVSRFLWRLQHQGIENIPSNGGLIIASNHQTYIDPFWIGVPIERPLRFLAWNIVLDWPLLGKFMRLLGAWPLQLQGSDPAAIRRSLQWLRDGGALVIFPEGGRGRPDGSMMKFKAGAIRIALEAGVPILPVTIRGANKVWPIGRRCPRTGHVEITFHPLYHVKQMAGEEARACARREGEALAKIIRSAL